MTTNFMPLMQLSLDKTNQRTKKSLLILTIRSSSLLELLGKSSIYVDDFNVIVCRNMIY
jgi:hypothetical protein